MKKIISILMLVCLLGSFAACGQQEETAAVIITPEPVAQQETVQTEQTQVDVPDVAAVEQGETAATGNESGDQASRPNSGVTTTTTTGGNTTANTDTDNTGDTGEDKLAIAQGYVGSSLAALEAAIGYPSGSEYVQSCLEDGLQEGLLYYDGFMVWTIQYSDGSEIVKGVS